MSTSFMVVTSSFQSPSPLGASSRLTFHHHEADADASTSSSDESSSIGSASDDEDPVLDCQDEAQSKSTADGSGSGSSFGSLSCLEDSLPIKRGLSNNFVGKSRSFSNLAECANVGDIAKAESPFNRKRRILIASRFSYKRRASCSSLISSCMLPSLLSPEEALHEGDEENEDENNDDVKDDSSEDEDDGLVRNRKTLALKSPRSLPLFDLRYA